MEQLEVQNTTEDEIAVQWDGMQIYFKPGQKKVFVEGVARSIVNEAAGLEVVSDEDKKVKKVKESPAEVIEQPSEEEEVIDEPPVDDLPAKPKKSKAEK